MAENRARDAAQEYIARRDRLVNPDGEFDRKGRWRSSEEETQTCCAGIRCPSRAYPYSEMVHCRTVAHVAQLYGVTEADLRRELRVLEAPAYAARAARTNDTRRANVARKCARILKEAG